MMLRALLLSCFVLPFLACGSKTETNDHPASGGFGGTAIDAAGAAGAAHAAGRGGSNGAGGSSSGAAAGTSASGAASGGVGGVPAGGMGGATGGVENGGEAGAESAACREKGDACTYSSECCSHFCSEQTHTCTSPNYCPKPCAAGSYCKPGFQGKPNTCEPAPEPQCPADSSQAPCNRCIVEHCAAEVVYCSCEDECFDIGSGCLPVCGNTDFAGFTECQVANCADICKR